MIKGLVEKINQLINHPELDKYIDKRYNGDWIEVNDINELSEFADLFFEIVKIASDKLIDFGNLPNYQRITELKKLGIKILPGEVEDGEWIYGIIDTNKGKIRFE